MPLRKKGSGFVRPSGDSYPSLIVHVPGSILGIDNHLTLAADVAICPTAVIMDSDHLCFNMTIYVKA